MRKVFKSGIVARTTDSANDGKSPGFWFYPGDFERDMAGISLAAQGLWTRMLGWAHQNEVHRGFLELPNGDPMTDKQIALRVGRSAREVCPHLRELENYSVFSRTTSGVVYCRRMARETYISEVRRAAAKSRTDKANRAANGTFAGEFDTAGERNLMAVLLEQRESKTPSVTASVSDSDSSIPHIALSRGPKTDKISELDRAYVRDYIAEYHATNDAWPEPGECPYRSMDWRKAPSDGMVTLSIEFGEWVLGTMPFRKPSTWGMVHFVPQIEIDRMNEGFPPVTAETL